MQIELALLFFYFDLLFMHQSFESPTAPAPPPPPPPLPIRALAGDEGEALTSDTLHVGSPEGGEFAGSHRLRIPYQGNKWGITPWSADFIFVPHGNIALFIVALIVHILQSALTITINICQYMYLVSLSQIFLFVIVECTSGPD